ncbi:MAG: YicC/YloC family endoribonuclease [Acutalibacteraceae bacterium]|nr:YicC/YloC family endoribonuclease [Acutalibacteraceae bacterium]
MVRSMTGYGRHQETIDSMNITVEIKSVNHRYFDFSSRTPRIYGFLDEKLKSFVQSKVARGKIECYVQVDNLEDDSVVVEINHSLAKGYVEAFKSLSESYGIDNNLNAGILARFNDVLLIRKEEADEEKIWSAVKSVAETAVDKFISMRKVEGEKLRDDICSRADNILEKVEYVESRSPETVKEYTKKLLARMNDVLSGVNVDEARILTEAAIYADKIAVAEETVRLRSHLEQLKGFFESEEAIGRKMDFLVQEINREANTIGSKACDVEIARCVLDIKSEVEKIREQVQNIE